MGSEAESQLLQRLAEGVGVAHDGVDFTGSPTLDSFYPVSELAAASIGVAGLAAAALAEVAGVAGLGRPQVVVDRALADAWFASALRPVGWETPSPWDPIAGDYRTLPGPDGDGWIRLHTNAPRHRAAALRVLGVAADRDEVADAVASWVATDLETAVVDAGGCAAELRTPAAWVAHPQGAAVGAEALVRLERTDATSAAADLGWHPTAAAPLAGLRVLDLTRVLAGPVATRFLAGFGAQVLRIDPPDWDEPAIVPDMTLGKRAARLDARDPDGLRRLIELLASADVLVSGYRGDALERLGLGERVRRDIRPGLVDVSLTAYGSTGPWANRRGFDSLVQLSTGIAGAGMFAGVAERTTPLPVQTLDHATGYLAAASVLRGLTIRTTESVGVRARLSLARTAVELEAARGLAQEQASPAPSDDGTPLETPWGAALLHTPPVTMRSTSLSWSTPPRPLGSDDPLWV